MSTGPLPHVQDIIAPVGYDPEGLQGLADLLMAWRANQATTHLRLLSQKRARRQRDETRQEIEQVVSSFKQTAKAVFEGNENVLRFLGICPPRWCRDSRSRNGAAGAETGSGASRSRRSGESESLGACLSRWRQMMANAQDLAEAQETRLAAAALVETLALTDSKYKEAIAAHSTQQLPHGQNLSCVRRTKKPGS